MPKWPTRWPMSEEEEEGEEAVEERGAQREEGKGKEKEGRGLTPKELEKVRKALREGKLVTEEVEEEAWKALEKRLLKAYVEKGGTRGPSAAKELLGEVRWYYRRKLRGAAREVGRGARLERVVAEMPRVIAFASLGIAVGALAAFIEGFLWQTGAPLSLLLAIILTVPYTFIYVFFIAVVHGLAATVLLSVTKVVRGYTYRRTVVDMFFWTVFSAAIAASCRAAWMPFLLGLLAWPLLAIAAVLAPLYFVVGIALLVALLILLVFLAQAASEGGAWGFLAKALLVLLGAPFLLVAGVPAALFSLAKMTDAAWEFSDVPIAFLIALFSFLQWLAPPLAATVLAGVWIFFGIIAAATREWDWLRVPLAATVVHAMNVFGYTYDLAASAAVEVAWWLGEVTGSVGIRLAALAYAFALQMEGVRLVPLLGAWAPPQEKAWTLLQEAVRDLLRGVPPALP